ncbi:CidA/LrgA family protein [Paludibacter jiangxiensis]|uniref:Holin-like protein n=1 Tax=Paludibacter jiangxiensis TaxID=681398 RepID=A0A170YYI2_9BACT|nr:CidA/LrgA family protein [Paludibacter jiangxiensis]MDP4203319.1 CidA/LrgA family protein [Bacteroidota bacterium]GAT62182.1 holin-like protein [Paludibacter jiangxiensis]
MAGIFILLFYYFLGTLVAYLIGNFIPGSIMGMLLLFLSLVFKIIKPEQVRKSATFFLDNMMLFFIPLGVGLIASYALIGKFLTAITIASAVSTVLVLVVVALIAQKMEGKKDA